MKVIAVIPVSFERSDLGTSSRLNQDLLGETVLRRTLRRVLAAKRLTSSHLIVHKSQAQLARDAASGLAVSVETHDAAPLPWRDYVVSARKWSLDSWRGGIGSMSVLDEPFDPWVLDAMATRDNVDAVVCVPSGASLLDPELLDRMIEHFEKVRADVRLTFTQSAPGLSATVCMPAMLSDMVRLAQPPGRIIAYRPGDPQKDMVMQPCYFPPDPVVGRATGRCIADTQAAVDRMKSILLTVNESNGAQSHDVDSTPDAATISRWLTDNRFNDIGALPAEVEIELTTADPLPDSTLRPRGKHLGDARGPMDDGLFDRLVDELSRRDDVRVVLGGFGDPLMHPQFERCVRRCREAGIFAIAVRTPAVTLEEGSLQVLFDQRVDVLNVLIDAATAETYRRVHNADCLHRVMANMDRVLERHRRMNQYPPLLVCEMIKTRETMAEMEAFYDTWVSRTGAAVLTGPSHYSGRWPDHAVMRMAPPTRFTCTRLFTRTMVLADGRVTACDQDFRGEHAIGSIQNSTLSELWTGEGMRRIRHSHLNSRYEGMPICAACEEWHRP